MKVKVPSKVADLKGIIDVLEERAATLEKKGQDELDKGEVKSEQFEEKHNKSRKQERRGGNLKQAMNLDDEFPEIGN